MEHVQVRTAQNVGIDYEVAGLGDRVLAALIDYGVLAVYVLMASILGALIDATVFWAVASLPFLLYFLLCEVFFDGQSLGKSLRKIRVARLDGTEPTLANYLVRWLLRPLDLDLTSGLVAVLTVLITGTGQRLGDLAAGTTVIALRPRVALQDTLFAALDADYQPTFPEAVQLSDDDVTTAREVLNALLTDGTTHTTFQLGQRMKSALEAKMGRTSDLSPTAFLRTVIRDYNHLAGRLG